MTLGLTLVSIGGYASTAHRYWAWIAIGLLFLLAVSFAWTARTEYRHRVAAEAQAHMPPGGGIPLHAPVEYQVTALRQVIARVSETLDHVDYSILEGVLKNLSRTGTDPIYEPLHPVTCREGLARLVELGELEEMNKGAWRIKR